ncbi:TadE/TadG family type IV pilus assembly protein [Isoptericola sp. NPDC056578]|uniref:TadE/TadG family type IV pilus assembly protein n=1 Tax=unclassified Isoptericola TaxID=2623355 RepID=UPI00369EA997
MRRRPGPRHARADSRERGSATVELTVILPVVLLLFFGLMQGALISQGKATAIAAAQEGARIAAGESGSVSEGVAAARSFVAVSSLGSPASGVTGARNAEEATMTVTVRTKSVVPFWKPRIVQSASMPIERVTG